MNLRAKIGLFVAGVLGCTLILQRCNKPVVITNPGTTIITTHGDELIVTPHVKPGQPAQPPVHIYQPDPGSTTINIDTHGNVTYQVRQFGVGFQPGIGVSCSDRLRVDLDARVVYFKRFGLNAGLAFAAGSGVSLANIVKPYGALTYTPFDKFANTSVFVGMQLDKTPIGGIRVRF
jgi:hypothetical protein